MLWSHIIFESSPMGAPRLYRTIIISQILLRKFCAAFCRCWCPRFIVILIYRKPVACLRVRHHHFPLSGRQSLCASRCSLFNHDMRWVTKLLFQNARGWLLNSGESLWFSFITLFAEWSELTEFTVGTRITGYTRFKGSVGFVGSIGFIESFDLIESTGKGARVSSYVCSRFGKTDVLS